MRAKSAFGTQADKNDRKLDQTLAGAVLGLAACMLAGFSGGSAASDYDLTSSLMANAPVAATIASTTPLSR